MSRGLGKGLDAIFNNSSEDVEETVEELAVKELRPNPYQPRRVFSEEAIQELASSIATHGVLQPIIVRQSIKGYELVIGERRFRAAKEAGLNKIPAVVKGLSDEEMMEVALIENLQREDLNPLEEARAYEKLMNELEFTQEDLADRLGKSRPHIANHIRLLHLPEELQDWIADKKISMGHGRTLLSLDTKEEMVHVGKKVINEGLNVRQTEELVQQIKGRVSRETKKEQRDVSPYIREREEQLKSHFGTSVAIKQGKKKGKIEIEFFTDDDLERIMELLHTSEEE
ncbi:ParB family chromosome partitioning protein [Salsuginibacillus halophilus]|uniref:ParB family chromosome partitioning protein n=1 Tax=Salsuginibacillus halophilus TaxID=517424 RepID=A0A2P8HI82_9BACI|nr:ParB/RepB/Spo0J family partition protein [Salsuginibacillus halophilus]PSL45932.1 ParB family chromosome partitioning protein [Salsuginibacillus halophilus]